MFMIAYVIWQPLPHWQSEFHEMFCNTEVAGIGENFLLRSFSAILCIYMYNPSVRSPEISYICIHVHTLASSVCNIEELGEPRDEAVHARAYALMYIKCTLALILHNMYIYIHHTLNHAYINTHILTHAYTVHALICNLSKALEARVSELTSKVETQEEAMKRNLSFPSSEVQVHACTFIYVHAHAVITLNKQSFVILSS